MKEFEWTFSSGNYINVKRIDDTSHCAYFSYDDKLKFQVAWTVSSLTEFEWDCVLACVKQAKAVLKKLKRI